VQAYFNTTTQLVERTPKPLIDYPRSDFIDINDDTAKLCDELCVEMNAHAVVANRHMGDLAARLGLDAVADAYRRRSESIRAKAHDVFAALSQDCNPADVGPCYADEPVVVAEKRATNVSTTVQASIMAAFANIAGGANATLQLVPFIRARNARRGPAHGLEASGWVAGFMMEGLLASATAVDEGDISVDLAAAAADLVFEALTGRGKNSWMGGMITDMNATMTTESWTVPDEGGATMSHPWTASPASVVPRWLMGVRPAQAGWKRVAIRPAPPSYEKLATAALRTPTPRGDVLLQFSQGVDDVKGHFFFDANVTLPGNTAAQLCLPLFAAPATMRSCATTIPMSRRGAVMCTDEDLIAGTTRASLTCTHGS